MPSVFEENEMYEMFVFQWCHFCLTKNNKISHFFVTIFWFSTSPNILDKKMLRSCLSFFDIEFGFKIVKTWKNRVAKFAFFRDFFKKSFFRSQKSQFSRVFSQKKKYKNGFVGTLRSTAIYRHYSRQKQRDISPLFKSQPTDAKVGFIVFDRHLSRLKRVQLTFHYLKSPSDLPKNPYFLTLNVENK